MNTALFLSAEPAKHKHRARPGDDMVAALGQYREFYKSAK